MVVQRNSGVLSRADRAYRASSSSRAQRTATKIATGRKIFGDQLTKVADADQGQRSGDKLRRGVPAAGDYQTGVSGRRHP